MLEEQYQKLENALRSPTPLDNLRNYALELSRNGLNRKAVYAIYREMFDKLENDGREVDQGNIEILLDSITQFMSPSNPLFLNLPE